MKQLILNILLLFALTGLLQAGDAGRESPFSVGVGARALGMGGGFTALSDDASAIFYNPSALPGLSYQEVSFMHMTLFEGTIYDFASWVIPSRNVGGVGVSFMRIGTNDITRRSGFQDDGHFDYSYSQFVLSYGRNLHHGFAFGGNLKILNQSIDIHSDYGFGFDFSMIARLNSQISFGIMARDIVPPTLELITTEESVPLTMIAGIAARKIKIGDQFEVSAAFDLEKAEDRSIKVHGGSEILFEGLYAIRGGYDRENLSFGAGFKYGQFMIDYAYKIMDYFEDSHRFSMTYLIGKSVEEKVHQELLDEQRRSIDLLEGERHRQFIFYQEKGSEFYNKQELDSALSYYQRALAFDQSNRKIINTISDIEREKEAELAKLQAKRETELEQNKYIETYYTQAQNFYVRKYYPAALDMLELILDVEPEHEQAFSLKNIIMGTILNEVAESMEKARKARQKGELVRAIELYTRILYLDPGNNKAQRELEVVAPRIDLAGQLNNGMELFKQGKLNEARKVFKAVLAASPDEPVAKEYLSRLHASVKSSSTLDMIQQDKKIWSFYLDGLRYMRNKEYAKAIEAWEKVMEAYPNNENTLMNIEQARLRLESEPEK